MENQTRPALIALMERVFGGVILGWLDKVPQDQNPSRRLASVLIAVDFFPPLELNVMFLSCENETSSFRA